MLAIDKQKYQMGRKIGKSLLISFLITFLVAKIFATFLGTKYLPTGHTVLELNSIFISFLLFLFIWYTYEYMPESYRFLCFGFLLQGIFVGLHLLISPEKTMFTLFNLSIWYCLIGEIILVLLLLMFSFIRHFSMNKYSGLFLSFLLAGFIAVWLYQVQDFLPLLFNVGEYSSSGLMVRSLVVCLYLFVFYKLQIKIREDGVPHSSNLLSALLMIIAAKICFCVPLSLYFYHLWGHAFKAAAFFFFLRGIFAFGVQAPCEKLARGNESFVQIFDEIPLGIVVYDRNFRLFFANKKALHFLHYDFTDLHGLHHDELVRKLGFEDVLRKRVQENKILRNIYVELENGVGEKYKVKGDYYSLFHYYLILFEEVRENQELEALKIQTKIILDSVNKLVILFDVEQRVQMCNQKCLQVLGVSEEQVVGKTAYELATQFNLKTEKNLQKQKGCRDIQKLREISIVTTRGEQIDFLFQIDYLKNLAGKRIGAIIIATDITTIKKDNFQAQEKERLAILEQMSAGIVHEIKNPLMAIKGFSQLIKHKNNDEKIQEYALLIDQETEIINNFVTDFLTFAGPASSNLQKISLNEVVQATRLIIETNTSLKNIQVSFQLNSMDKLIMADTNKLRQVILNIVKNAIEVVEDQEAPQIKIKTKYHRRSKEVSLAIYNNGPAMTPEEKEMIGTPFYTTKRKGTGLGLSICFQIIKEHQGHIEVKSVENWGTSFSMYLPCVI